MVTKRLTSGDPGTFAVRQNHTDWDRYMDGDIHIFTQDTDFVGPLEKMRARAMNAANLRELQIRTHVDRTARTLTIQVIGRK